MARTWASPARASAQPSQAAYPRRRAMPSAPAALARPVRLAWIAPAAAQRAADRAPHRLTSRAIAPAHRDRQARAILPRFEFGHVTHATDWVLVRLHALVQGVRRLPRAE